MRMLREILPDPQSKWLANGIRSGRMRAASRERGGGAGRLHRRMHGRAAGDGGRAFCARVRRGYPQHGGLPRALGVAVDYVTALGDDPWSDEMAPAGRRGRRHRLRRAPARADARPLHHPDRRPRRTALPLLARQRARPRPVRRVRDGRASSRRSPATTCSTSRASRCRSMARPGARACRPARPGAGGGRRIVFDTNFRPRGWPDRALARRAYRAAFERADIVLASTEDLELLFGEAGSAELTVAPRVGRAGVEARHARLPGDHGRRRRGGPAPTRSPTSSTPPPPGDSFAAAYIAARLAGAAPARRPTRAIGSPAWWCAIPEPSSRMRPCRPASRPRPGPGHRRCAHDHRRSATAPDRRPEGAPRARPRSSR